jgi:hypothetical protein
MATVAPSRSSSTFWIAAAVGAAVSIALGVYANGHDASAEVLFTWGFQDQITFKVWFTTAVLALAILQVLTAGWMWGKLGRAAPAWVGPAHRLIGIAAFVVSLPVAYHCLWSLGFRTGAGWRPYLHSLLGCAFYGVFTVKVLCVRSHRMPGWALPVVGGLTFAVLAALWASSALWFFTTAGFPGW